MQACGRTMKSYDRLGVILNFCFDYVLMINIKNFKCWTSIIGGTALKLLIYS